MIQGSITALITPFLEDGSIDFVSFKKLVSWQIEQGSDGLVICGSTGEGATLSYLEQKQLIEVAVLEAKGKVPIIVGTGTNDTRTTLEKTKQAKEAGADGCLVIFPYYNKPTFEGCVAHFQKISDCNFPIIVYHHPGRTGLCFSPSQLAELCQIPNIVGLKEAAGNVEAALQFMRLTKTPLFSGDDALAIPLISMGAKGSISVIGNIRPREWADLIKMALQDEIKEAKKLYHSLNPLCEVMFLETNPQCIKYAMSLEEHCLPFLRLPLLPPQERTKKQIETVVNFLIRVRNSEI
ncbi:MAG: 4-hydroxy-tetrahydrodipicolinate synthase [Verrucomicrobia bacterium]|nr:4-hydroxy-tetrahydrodipicolinate synthase [Verrucomicrobiota bacterium]